MEDLRAAIGWGRVWLICQLVRPGESRVHSRTQFALIVSGSLLKHTEPGAEVVTATGGRIIGCSGGYPLRLK